MGNLAALPPSRADYLEIWEPQNQACTGFAVRLHIYII